MLFSTCLTVKYQSIFVLTQDNTFSEKFYFETSRKILGSSKNWYLGFLK